MKASDLRTALTYLVMVMAGCPSSDKPNDDAGTRSHGPDSAPSGSGMRDSGGGHDDARVATCTPALGRFMGPSCETCLEDNCQAVIASCTFDDCVQCLLTCTTCESACTTSTADAGSGEEVGAPTASDAGDTSGDDVGAPSCDKINSGNCCSFASFAGLGTQCQQAVSSNHESICATLLSNLQGFGVCR